MYISAGMQELAKIQNKILGDLIQAYSKNKVIDHKFIVDDFQYPPQRVKENHILKLKVDDETTLRYCSLSNITYGQGQELVYDFARIEGNLIKDILHKKFFHTDNFEFIHYQLELFIKNGDRANFITEIRQKIPQQPLDKEDRIRIL
jgi:hypothetical protein